MALTQNQLACREILAEDKALLHTQQSDDSATYGDKLVRYWEGIPHGLQDDCLAFLKAMTSASNTPNITVAGDPSPYDVTGEYGFTGSQWTMGTHKIMAADFGGDDVYELSNIYSEVLYRSNTAGGELPNIDDAVWTAVGLINAGNSWTRPLESFMVGTFGVGWEYTTTGTITTTETLPNEIPQTSVQNPIAEWHVRTGVWAAHALSLDQKGGTWTITQTLVLANDGTDFILVEALQPLFFCRYVVLYPNVAQSELSAFVCELKDKTDWADDSDCLDSDTDYMVESVRSRKTGTAGMYDVYVTLVCVPEDEVSEEVNYETSEGGWGVADWTFVNNFKAIKKSDGSLNYYQLFQDALPFDHLQLAQVRRVTVTVTKSYFSAEPTRPLGSAVATGADKTSTFLIHGGKKYRLPNGMWVAEGIVTAKLIWGTEDAES